MGRLLRKEISLAIHPTAWIFLLLAGMMLIPNYPYYVNFFYVGLSIFFTCLTGRETNDIFYTMTLPVEKRSVVSARFTVVLMFEVLQALICIPFAILRQHYPEEIIHNQVGMDANIAFFGLAFVMLGLFNFIFFTGYYKNVNKVGSSFIKASVVVFLYMGVAESCTHIIPFFRDKLDTLDNVYIPEKLIVLGIGIVIFALLSLAAYKKSVKSFEQLDL